MKEWLIITWYDMRCRGRQFVICRYYHVIDFRSEIAVTLKLKLIIGKYIGQSGHILVRLSGRIKLITENDITLYN